MSRCVASKRRRQLEASKVMTTKKQARLRRSSKTRARIRRLGSYRLCIHRSPRHVYAQIIDQSEGRVLVSASTIERAVRDEVANGGNVAAAKAVGKRIGEKAVASGISQVSFDRSGFKYHGRVKALADSAREAGLQF